MFEQSHFEFPGEESFGQGFPFLRQRSGLEFVSRGLDDLQIETQFREGGAALCQDEVGLRQSQGAATGRYENRVIRGTHPGALDEDSCPPFTTRHAIRNPHYLCPNAGRASDDTLPRAPRPNRASTFSRMICSQRAISSLRWFR